MIINFLDLGGASDPFLKPIAGQLRGEVTVEGLGQLAYPRGHVFKEIPVEFWVKAWQGIGGQPANSFLAAKAFLAQVEEMVNNACYNPAYIRWTSTSDPTGYNATDPHDGWYEIDDLRPDYSTFIPSGWVKCTMKVTYIAPGPPRSTSIWTGGGSLASTYTGLGENLVSAFGATILDAGAASLGRTGAEGTLSVIISPNANPWPFVPSNTIANWFRGGVRVFDTVNTAVNGVPQSATATLWHSLGTEAGTDNSINYWTTLTGSPSYASHVLTLPAGALIQGGHPDWWDCIQTVRFTWATGGIADIRTHAPDGNNWVRAYCDGINIVIQKSVAGTPSGSLTQASAALTNGTSYWLRIQAIGTSYVGTVFADSAGAIGSQIAQTPAAVITDTAVQTGPLALGASGASINFGGAFSNVCTVTGPVPTNVFGAWQMQLQAGEPAFCWSKNSPYSGGYSASVYMGNAAGKGGWALPNTLAGGTYTLATALRGSGGTPNVFRVQIDGGVSAPPSAATIDGTWHQYTNTGADPGSATVRFQVELGTGTYYCDSVTVTDSSGNILLADSFEAAFNGNWIEVFDADHVFAGDCILTNGLQLLLFQVGALQLCKAYLWNLAAANIGWQQWGTPSTQQVSAQVDTTRGYSLARVSPGECALTVVQSTASGQAGQYLVRLRRARYEVRVEYTPLTAAEANAYTLYLLFSFNTKIVYNSGHVSDISLSETQPAIVGDYGYGVAVGPTSSNPFIAGFLYQNPNQSFQPGADAASDYIQLADTASLAKGATRIYGFYAAPYGVSGTYSTANLQAEAESSSDKGTGYSVVADAGASAGNALKCASGTGASSQASFGTVFTPSPGIYDVWFRVKVTSTAGSNAEFNLGLALGNLANWITGFPTAFRPNQVSTSYTWVRAGTVTLPTGQSPTTVKWLVQIASGITLGTDWFFDEAVLLPKALTNDYSGPQDIWQQWLYDRDEELVVA